jgi:hypothetical protein
VRPWFSSLTIGALFLGALGAGSSAFCATGFLTDIEGKWSKFDSWARSDNEILYQDSQGKLQLRDGAKLILGGDYGDRGPDSMKVIDAILELKSRFGDRVQVILGNHELGWLNFSRELTPESLQKMPPAFEQWIRDRTPNSSYLGTDSIRKFHDTPANRARWVFERHLHSPNGFEYRRGELAKRLGKAPTEISDESVVRSIQEDLASGGRMRKLLAAGKLIHEEGPVIAVHGAIHSGNEKVDLNSWYQSEIQAWAKGESDGKAIIDYQGPLPGQGSNPQSVVFSRYSDKRGRPTLPDAPFTDRQRAQGVKWIFSGHTPQGETVSVLRDGGVNYVLGDSGHDQSSLIILSDDGETLHVRSEVELKDGMHHLEFKLRANEESWIGRKVPGTSWTVRGQLENGEWLLSRVEGIGKIGFRSLPADRLQKMGIGAPAGGVSRLKCLLNALSTVGIP